MSKKSNDSIEEFFKKGVRKSDITFRESDWQKMERMLDERAMVGSASTSRPLRRIVGVVVIVALLSSIYFLIPSGGEEHSSNQKDIVAANNGKDQVDQLSHEQIQQAPHNKDEEDIQNQAKSQNVAPSQEQASTPNEQSLTKVNKRIRFMTPPLCSWVVGCPEAFKSKEASIHRFAGQGRARITGMRSFGNSFIPILFVSLKFVESEEEMRVSH